MESLTPSDDAAARLATILQRVDDAIASKTLEGTITAWNPAAERLFGYTAVEAVGRPLTALIIPTDRLAEQAEILARVRRGEVVDHLETVRLRKDGSRVPVALTVAPLRDPAGPIVGATKIARDLTPRKALEDVLAMVGHELRTPIAAIRSAAALLVQAGPGGAARPLAIIRRQAEQLARLTEDLLDFARVSRGLLLVHLAPCDLACAAEACLTALRAAGTVAQHQLDVHLEPVWVNADPVRLQQVITNLVTNAVAATPPGGTIRVRVEPAGEEAVLRVKDAGCGIRPELLPRVFDPFVRGEGAPPGGLGLGLALVRRLVERQGGRVEAHSDGPGRGSEFVVRLPRIEVARMDIAAPPEAGRSEVPLRVLLIEDDSDAREPVGVFLAKAGHEVHEAEDGGTGLVLADRVRPDVALIDLGLPGLDGYEVARRLRARNARVRCIALSGYGEPSDRARSRAAGFAAHLVKPVDPADLLRTLRAP